MVIAIRGDEAPAVMRVAEAAQYLGISRSKAYELIAAGQLPVIRVGRVVRVNRARLVEWLERNTLEVA